MSLINLKYFKKLFERNKNTVYKALRESLLANMVRQQA